MKKLLITFLLFSIIPAAHSAMNFDDAYAQNSKTPMAVLVYTDWATNSSNILKQFRSAQQTMGNSYNYVELNISNKESQSYMEKYTILQKIPYIMLYRGNCKFARLLDRDCASCSSCIISKMKAFTY